MKNALIKITWPIEISELSLNREENKEIDQKISNLLKFQHRSTPAYNKVRWKATIKDGSDPSFSKAYKELKGILPIITTQYKGVIPDPSKSLNGIEIPFNKCYPDFISGSLYICFESDILTLVDSFGSKLVLAVGDHSQDIKDGKPVATFLLDISFRNQNIQWYQGF